MAGGHSPQQSRYWRERQTNGPLHVLDAALLMPVDSLNISARIEPPTDESFTSRKMQPDGHTIPAPPLQRQRRLPAALRLTLNAVRPDGHRPAVEP